MNKRQLNDVTQNRQIWQGERALCEEGVERFCKDATRRPKNLQGCSKHLKVKPKGTLSASLLFHNALQTVWSSPLGHTNNKEYTYYIIVWTFVGLPVFLRTLKSSLPVWRVPSQSHDCFKPCATIILHFPHGKAESKSHCHTKQKLLPTWMHSKLNTDVL